LASWRVSSSACCCSTRSATIPAAVSPIAACLVQRLLLQYPVGDDSRRGQPDREDRDEHEIELDGE
jgi:hypothetical protein